MEKKELTLGGLMASKETTIGDIVNIPFKVRQAVYQYLGGDFENDSSEKVVEIFKKMAQMSKRELFGAFLEWEGIIGYTDLIIDTMMEIWKEDL
jgi:hypothetical protein